MPGALKATRYLKALMFAVVLASLLSTALPAQAADSIGAQQGQTWTVTYTLVPRSAVDATLVGTCGLVTFQVSNRGDQSYFFTAVQSFLGPMLFIDWNINWSAVKLAIPPQVSSGFLHGVSFADSAFWTNGVNDYTNYSQLVIGALTGDANVASPVGYIDCEFIPNTAVG